MIIAPVKQTRYKENTEKICFSMQAVETCPMGSTQLRNEKTILKKMSFTCFARSAPVASKLLNLARDGADLTHELSGYHISYSEEVDAETSCYEY